MAHLRTSAIICSVRPHGEHGAVVRSLTPENGLVAGYVRGARSRTMRPVLIPSNIVQADYRARTEDQLASMTAELVQSRGAWLGEPLASAGLNWATALTAAILPEEHSYPRLHSALSALLDAICQAPSAKGWAVALVRYELLLLSELGFGLALDKCIVSGSEEDLVFISPKSAAAVSSAAGESYRERLLPLPDFLRSPGQPDWNAIFDGLKVTGFFLQRHFFADRRNDVMASRAVLVDRLKRIEA
ncbi:DNA replication and repair protein RecO [Parasphingorhabdus marina DSM 22363]|uniref:DNA repair protein RecO n=1 Tax=Parasphingorhabdus marina DSM 22363 TaxID=1123272 RepID=A0A1N6G5Q6_9SPHN|nr:DNA repair protein RecO [Parasphingorhabdus marina]SIO02837.1 DNA replication and repair protein RecO [Parasphingorhabdus marina DSM 22363]